MTKTTKTLTIRTGRRTWNLTVTHTDGKRLWLVSKSGKTYLLVLASGLMKGLDRKDDTPKGKRRSYDWTVTNIDTIRAHTGLRAA